MITLKNDFFEIEILKRGVTFYTFKTLNDNKDIITGYKNMKNYEHNPHFLGSFVGPLSGRTEMNQYGMNLESPNNLHSGSEGICFKEFDAELLSNTQAIFTFDDRDIFYSINIQLLDNKLIVNVLARPRKPMPINITNHMYFNLEESNTLKDHFIKLDALEYSHVDKDLFNQYDLRKVENTVFDLNSMVPIKELLNRNHPQFAITGHIDHSFKGNQVTLRTKTKQLKVTTTTPFIHLYFANYFDQSFLDKKNRYAQNHASVAIEPQWLPNDLNLPIYSSSNPFFETFVYEITYI